MFRMSLPFRSFCRTQVLIATAFIALPVTTAILHAPSPEEPVTPAQSVETPWVYQLPSPLLDPVFPVFSMLPAPPLPVPSASPAPRSKHTAPPVRISTEDALSLRTFLAADAMTPEAQWMFALLTAPAEHPRVRLRFQDAPLVPIATGFDTASSTVVITVSRRTLKGIAPRDSEMVAERRVARVAFMHTAALVRTLETNGLLADYNDCAADAKPSDACFLILTIPHYKALAAAWGYALARGEQGLFGDSIVLDVGMYTALGLPPDRALHQALMTHLRRHDYPAMAWAEKYDIWFDLLAAEDENVRDRYAVLLRARASREP